MFGFLIKGEANDDAVKLKTLIDIIADRYSTLPDNQLVESIKNDFEDNHRYVDQYNINIMYKEMPDFQMSLDRSDSRRNVVAIGYGRYMGFMLVMNPDGSISVSAKDGIAYAATGGAKALVRAFVRKYDAYDISEIIKRH